jgi:hypothetical protein
MINQNNDAAISDADLDKVAGGFFAAFFANIRSKASSTGTTGGSERWWYERPGPTVSTDFTAIDPRARVSAASRPPTCGCGPGGLI